ncbi:hypothetical protein AJ79_01446 [Helicocarpus griseus UAMH5409]|uniref:Small ribosomal subunit protein uS7m n=1 Tax=Helicocarpus griseus UAMH5409 TaxID=1447875 RepID=A0A2B7Y7E3_9EURO|nr:hypothetical protein AJ79_01446 [Helicocarpus griseus UAMH5409]
MPPRLTVLPTTRNLLRPSAPAHQCTASRSAPSSSSGSSKNNATRPLSTITSGARRSHLPLRPACTSVLTYRSSSSSSKDAKSGASAGAVGEQEKEQVPGEPRKIVDEKGEVVAEGSAKDALGHVSEEAAEMAEIMGRGRDKAECGEVGGPELQQGSMVGDILKRDEDALKNAPKVLRDQMKSTSSWPSGSRSYSTSTQPQPQPTAKSPYSLVEIKGKLEAYHRAAEEEKVKALIDATEFSLAHYQSHVAVGKLIERISKLPPSPPAGAASPQKQGKGPEQSEGKLEAIQRAAKLALNKRNTDMLNSELGEIIKERLEQRLKEGIPEGLKYPVPENLPRSENLKHRYDPMIDQFTKMIMRHGKLSAAQKQMNKILHNLRSAPSPNPDPTRPLLPSPPAPQLPLNPIVYLTTVVDSVAPLLRIKQQPGAAGGGRALPIPLPLAERQRRRTAIKWIIDASAKRKDAALANRISQEIIAVAEGKSSAWEKRAMVHKQGMVARANIKALGRKMKGKK